MDVVEKMTNNIDNKSSLKTAAEKERLSSILARVFSPDRESTSFGNVIDELDHHGMAIVLILFSIPSALPIPAAGYSTVLSIPLFCVAYCFLKRRETIWLPEKVRAKEFKPATFKKLYKPMLKLVGWIENFSKPRMVYLVSSRLTPLLLGFLICALAVSMVLPIPFTNTLPAGGIFLIGFSLLEDDGFLLLVGLLYSFLALLLSCTVIFGIFYYGTKAVEQFGDQLKDQIISLF